MCNRQAVETDPVSDIINEAVRESLAEDAEGLAAFEERADEPRVPLENVLRDLRKRGRLQSHCRVFRG